MLLAIAERSLQPYDYDKNRELWAAGRSLFNARSGIARRFESRGLARPTRRATAGYVMPEATAAVVREVLAYELA